MLKKIVAMEKQAYKDFVDCAERRGDEDPRTTELRYRWLGMLEMKRELVREFDK